jgi:hypothetical protein
MRLTLSRDCEGDGSSVCEKLLWSAFGALRGDAGAMTVNWLMIEIVNAAGAVTYRNSFITDLEHHHAIPNIRPI